MRDWTLADMINDRQFASLLAEAEKALQSFVRADGPVAFDLSAHVVTATKL